MRRNILLVASWLIGLWCLACQSCRLCRNSWRPNLGGPTRGIAARGATAYPAAGDHRPFLPVQRRRPAALPGGGTARRPHPGLCPRLDHAGVDLDAADPGVLPPLPRGGVRSARAGRFRRSRQRLRAGAPRPGRRRTDRASGRAEGGGDRLVAGRARHAGVDPRRGRPAAGRPGAGGQLGGGGTAADLSSRARRAAARRSTMPRR